MFCTKQDIYYKNDIAMKQNTIQITGDDLRSMVNESVKRLIREYWTSADDAAQAAHDEAKARIEQEFQDLIHSDQYKLDIERLEFHYDLFMREVNKQKKWLESKFNFEKRFDNPEGIGNDIGYKIVVRKIDGGVKENSKEFDFNNGHRLDYLGNDYESGTLGYTPGDRLILKVEFSLEPEYETEEHVFSPTNGYWRTNDAGERTRIEKPDIHSDSEYVGPSDRPGRESWTSPSPDWRHDVRRGRGFSRSWLDDGEPEEMAEAYTALAIKRIAERGEDYNMWTIKKNNSYYKTYIAIIR